jgi:indole-3-glycerol phosphate synthase
MEARSLGADVILLIASVLGPAEVRRLGEFAVSLGMEVLLELHDPSEAGHICDPVQLVGVNNRNLSDFSVDVGRSLALARQLPTEKVWVAESGLQDPAVVASLRTAGFRGFLIGEHFMRHANPEEACSGFIRALRNA